MIKKHKKMILVWAINAVGFYLLPLIGKDTGSFMMILLLILPLMVFLLSFIYGTQESFNWIYAIGVAVLFVPCIFLYYNSSAMIYPILYGILAIGGDKLGTVLFSKNTEKEKNI